MPGFFAKDLWPNSGCCGQNKKNGVVSVLYNQPYYYLFIINLQGISEFSESKDPDMDRK
jgi:hypothetical protein